MRKPPRVSGHHKAPHRHKAVHASVRVMFGALSLVALIAVVVLQGQGIASQVSPEMRFTDATPHGLQIIPASGGSLPSGCGSGTLNDQCWPAPTCSLSVSPSTVNRSSSSATLSWNSYAADTFYISSITYVAPNSPGGTSVAPSVTTTYSGTVAGPGGYGYCSATLTVNQPNCSVAPPYSADNGGYTLASGAGYYLVSKFSLTFCISNTTGRSYFIPAATVQELTTFYNAAPGISGLSRTALYN